MSDTPISPEEVRYANAISFQSINAARKKNNEKLLMWGFCASLALNFLLGMAVKEVFPLVRYVHTTSFMNEAGVQDQVEDYTDLPTTLQQAGIENVLQMYLNLRERSISSEADRDYDIVTKLTDDSILPDYQNYANAKLNPDAPVKRLGPTGFIRVNILRGAGAADWIQHADDWTSGTYMIHWCRTIAEKALPVVSQRFESQLSFVKDPNVPADQKRAFNAPSIVIKAYPPAREEGAPGAANSCVQQ